MVKISKLGKMAFRILLTALAGFAAVIPFPAIAHPMGNFSINHYAGFHFGAKNIGIRYVLDLAEIPTVAERETMDTNGDGKIDQLELDTYAIQKTASLHDGLRLQVDAQPVTIQVTSRHAVLNLGAGGLNTLRVTMNLVAAWPSAKSTTSHAVHYEDTNYPARTGWKEIAAVADAPATLTQSTAHPEDLSGELTHYPSGLTVAAPAQTDADFTVSLTGHPALASGNTPSSAVQHVSNQTPSKSATPRDAFTEAIAVKNLTPGLMLFGLLLAFIFGAFHALSPGHGKTMVAAYLVGSRGTIKHAILLGIVVTITHTFGVFVLGIATLYASQYIVPEKLYPVLSAVSGAMVCGVGIWLLVSRLRVIGHNSLAREHGHSHDHEHSHEDEHALQHAQGIEHSHDHEAHDHEHDHAGGHVHSHGFGHSHSHDIPEGPITAKSLIALGISGGIVPCPSALVVLLSAIALHRTGYGLLLISAFSLGLASVLVALGILVVSAAFWLKKLPHSEKIATRLPIASAAAITVIGLILIVRAFGQGSL